MSNRQRLTWQQKLKASRLRLRYYARQVAKLTLDRYTSIILILSICLFLFVIFYPISRSLQVTGVVREEIISSNGAISFRPVPNAIVEIGGFRTFTNSEGEFTLRFQSAERDSIPIIYRVGTRERISRINFEIIKKQLQQDLIIK
jgi:hypothetical protein